MTPGYGVKFGVHSPDYYVLRLSRVDSYVLNSNIVFFRTDGSKVFRAGSVNRYAGLTLDPVGRVIVELEESYV